MKNIVVFSGSSHPEFGELICQHLGVKPGAVELKKFSNLETDVKIQESVRGKDVYIVQSGCGNVNDSIIELLIMVGACKTSTAKSVNAVLPSFPYARQPDVPYAKNKSNILRFWTPKSVGLTEQEDSQLVLEDSKLSIRDTNEENFLDDVLSPTASFTNDEPEEIDSANQSKDRLETLPELSPLQSESTSVPNSILVPNTRSTPISIPKPGKNSSFSYSLENKSSFAESMKNYNSGSNKKKGSFTLSLTEREMTVGSPTSPLILPALNQPTIAEMLGTKLSKPTKLIKAKETPNDIYFANPVPKNQGYKHWSARTGTLVANLLAESDCGAGADRIITMDLHDPQFQGYFDVPVDLLFAEPSIVNYIKESIIGWKSAVVVSPDAGGAKRAMAIAKILQLDFAMIHREGKVRDVKRMALVGNVKDKVAIIIDDIADTCGTLGLAAEVLAAEGAQNIHAIVTHGMLSGPALEVINASLLSTVAVSNTIPHKLKLAKCAKLRTIDVSNTFAEAIRRVYYGESLTKMFECKLNI